MAQIPSLPVTIPGSIVPGTLSVDSVYNNVSSIYNEYPYIFECQISLLLESTSDNTITPLPYLYGANNITVGMWFGLPNGYCYQIVQIVSVDSNQTLTVKIQDVNLYNLYSDPSQSGSNIPSEGEIGVVFSLDENGLPIFGGMTLQSGQLPQKFYWISDIYARFQYRNLVQSYYTNNLGATGYSSFNVGELVYLSSSGSFQKPSTEAEYQRAFGVVSSVNEPEGGLFSITPPEDAILLLDSGLLIVILLGPITSLLGVEFKFATTPATL